MCKNILLLTFIINLIIDHTCGFPLRLSDESELCKNDYCYINYCPCSRDKNQRRKGYEEHSVEGSCSKINCETIGIGAIVTDLTENCTRGGNDIGRWIFDCKDSLLKLAKSDREVNHIRYCEGAYISVCDEYQELRNNKNNINIDLESLQNPILGCNLDSPSIVINFDYSHKNITTSSFKRTIIHYYGDNIKYYKVQASKIKRIIKECDTYWGFKKDTIRSSFEEDSRSCIDEEDGLYDVVSHMITGGNKMNDLARKYLFSKNSVRLNKTINKILDYYCPYTFARHEYIKQRSCYYQKSYVSFSKYGNSPSSPLGKVTSDYEKGFYKNSDDEYIFWNPNQIKNEPYLIYKGNSSLKYNENEKNELTGISDYLFIAFKDKKPKCVIKGEINLHNHYLEVFNTVCKKSKSLIYINNTQTTHLVICDEDDSILVGKHCGSQRFKRSNEYDFKVLNDKIKNVRDYIGVKVNFYDSEFSDIKRTIEKITPILMMSIQNNPTHFMRQYFNLSNIICSSIGFVHVVCYTCKKIEKMILLPKESRDRSIPVLFSYDKNIVKRGYFDTNTNTVSKYFRRGSSDNNVPILFSIGNILYGYNGKSSPYILQHHGILTTINEKELKIGIQSHLSKEDFSKLNDEYDDNDIFNTPDRESDMYSHIAHDVDRSSEYDPISEKENSNHASSDGGSIFDGVGDIFDKALGFVDHIKFPGIFGGGVQSMFSSFKWIFVVIIIIILILLLFVCKCLYGMFSDKDNQKILIGAATQGVVSSVSPAVT